MQNESREVLDELRSSIVNIDLEGAKRSAERALAIGLKPLDIVNKSIARAMQEVGEKYEKNEYFLTELVAAGTVTQAVMKVLEPLLSGPAAESEMLGTVVIGTVEGDLHDIGKNIVKNLLMGVGFKVYDLGVDVPPEKFVENAKEKHADLVAMSALLTTTIPAMGDVVVALQKAGIRDKVNVLIGGYHVTAEFSKQIGADGYANDAMMGIEIAKKLVTRST